MRILRLLCLSACALPQLAQAANIVIVPADGPGEGLNDPTPRTPVGGNSGTTLGAQRLIALQRAATIWGGLLESSVTIEIEARFDPLTCGAGGAVLGNAGPLSAHVGFAGALPGTIYPSALANAISGTDLNGPTAEIQTNFNTQVDAGCIPGAVFYYGLNSNPPPNGIDVLTIALHEFAHGLGVATFVDLATGARFQNMNDPYMLLLEDHSTGTSWTAMNNTQRRNSAIDTGDLHWTGTEVVAASVGLLNGRHASGHVQMFAPNPLDGGSSVSHLGDVLFPDEMMEPFFMNPSQDPGLAFEMLLDIGWQRLVVGVCGNGTVESGEDCDDSNTVNGDCCSSMCRFEPAGSPCGSATSAACDAADTCNGAGACDDNRAAPGSVCRPPASPCDQAETCDGQNPACPPDVGSPAGAVCRPAVSDCDQPETCDGVNPTCPPDAVSAAGVSCRPLQSVCDVAEVCDGMSPLCPADQAAAAGQICRPSLGGCDLEERCNGASALCPPDVTRPPGFICRAGQGPCDAPETCNGANPACPPDALSPPGTVCRPAASACDLAERCNGQTATCPIDQDAPDGSSCSDGVVCNGEEFCNAGTCIAGPPTVCNDNDDCTADQCMEPQGCRFSPIPDCCATNDECDDGNLCTFDSCTGGTCVFFPTEGCCNADPDCEDGNACTIDFCANNMCVTRMNPGCADGGVPDQGRPDFGAPDFGVPDFGASDQSFPDRGAPDQSVLDRGGLAIPDARPGLDLSSADVPGFDAGALDGAVAPSLLLYQGPVGCGCSSHRPSKAPSAPTTGLWVLFLGFASAGRYRWRKRRSKCTEPA